jgi:hypothetical protein
MKLYGGVVVQVHVFLTSALVEVRGQLWGGAPPPPPPPPPARATNSIK